jgi:hypothetical protein
MERPAGVTILAVLGFIGAGMLVLAALGMLLGGAILANMATRPGLAMIGSVGGVVVAVVFLGIAALYLVIALGFLKLQNWARVLTIVLCGLGVLFNGLGVLNALIHFRVFIVVWQVIVVGIDLWVMMYLLKSHVKQAFGATGF